jgi:hypothetical protein
VHCTRIGQVWKGECDSLVARVSLELWVGVGRVRSEYTELDDQENWLMD